MKQPCKWFVPALMVLLLGMPLAGHAQQQQVYTWVDKNGVRHYSDHPGSPNAVLVTVDANATASAPVPATLPAAATAAGSAGKAQKVPQPKPRETPAQRAARCSKLRAQVKQLQSARRVEVTENGKTRYVSGEDLVKFRQQMQKRMQAACSPPSR